MAHYVCNKCGVVFSEDEAATETFRHDEVRPTFTEHFMVCPSCLSADYDDAAYCYHCHKPMRYEELKGGYYCMDCLRDMSSTRRVLWLYVKEDLDSYAEWMHERRARYQADEQDEKDRQHL